MNKKRKAEQILKKNHLRQQNVPDGCHNCKHVTIFDFYERFYGGCFLANESKWLVTKVEEFNICDKYEKVKI